MGKKLPSLVIVIPAYNEEDALPDVLERSLAVAEESAETWKILVIDDGSTDSTPEIVAEYGKKVEVVRHPENLGIAQTILEVFTLPDLEWAFFIPGDGQIPPEELTRLLPFTGRYDLVFAWRKERADPFKRILGAWIYNALISLVTMHRVHDVDSGVLFRAGKLRGLELESKSVFVHAEFLIKARERGLKDVEIPVRHEPRIGGESRAATFDVMKATFREVFAYAVAKVSGRRER